MVRCEVCNVSVSFKLVANFSSSILPHCFWPSWTKHGRILADIASGPFVWNFESGIGLLTCSLPNSSTANRSYKISTRKTFKIVTKRKSGEPSVPEQEEPGTVITITRNHQNHHHQKPSTHHATTIQNLPGIEYY